MNAAAPAHFTARFSGYNAMASPLLRAIHNFKKPFFLQHLSITCCTKTLNYANI